MRQIKRRLVQIITRLTNSINALSINIMASQTPSSSSHSPVTSPDGNSNIRSTLEEGSTNDSHSLRKIELTPPKSGASEEEASSLKNKDQNPQNTSQMHHPRIFDIRVGLDLQDFSLQTCRKRFQTLLPPYLSARISRSHLSLLNIADKIDNYLSFQRDIRGIKSILYSQISKTLQQKYGMDARLHQLRQILYLDKEFYTYQIEKKKSSYDVRLSVNGKYEGVQPRRTTLRRRIFEFLNAKHQEFLKSKGIEEKEQEGYWTPSFHVDIPIPLMALPWQQAVPKHVQIQASSKRQNTENLQDMDESSPVAQSSIKLHSLPSIEQRKQLSLRQIISKPPMGESFRDKLYRIIAQKQSRMKLRAMQMQKQKEMSIDPLTITKLAKESYLRIVDEINMLYTTKRISSMFYVNLVQNTVKRTGFHKGQIEDAIRDILLKSTYLEEVDTENGIIIRVNKNLYKQYRAFVENR